MHACAYLHVRSLVMRSGISGVKCGEFRAVIGLQERVRVRVVNISFVHPQKHYQKATTCRPMPERS